MRNDLVFLFSSMSENPGQFFQGYFFHDTDYVFGEGGFAEFFQVRGVDRLAGEDGCYVQMEKEQDGSYRFSTDHHGYKKLFYLWDNGFWIVSNSLYRISAHLRRFGRRVLPNYSQMAGMATEGTFYPSGRGSFFSQLTSFDTIIEGVRLVPADCAIRIGPSGFQLEKTIPQISTGDYQCRLGRFTSTWIGRLDTLLRTPAVQVSCDLTGGIDSRSVFSLLLGAVHALDSSIANPIQVQSGKGFRLWKDRLVASRICRHFDLPLNNRLLKRPSWLKGKASYSLWKDLCLGVYFPILFPNMTSLGNIVHLGGAGGEIHRPFYKEFLGAPSSDDFVARRTQNLVSRSARSGFKAALREALSHITDGSPEYLDAMACHYRHFRNRFHGGCGSQYIVKFLPLASKLLDDVTAVAGKARFHNAQMHYDILYNLQPELLDISFDSLRKRPGREVRRSLVSATPIALPPGSCFINDDRLPTVTKGKGKDPSTAIDHLREEFEVAKNGFAASFLGKAYVRRAERALQAAVRRGSFSTPIQSKRVAVVMACAMFDS